MILLFNFADFELFQRPSTAYVGAQGYQDFHNPVWSSVPVISRRSEDSHLRPGHVWEKPRSAQATMPVSYSPLLAIPNAVTKLGVGGEFKMCDVGDRVHRAMYVAITGTSVVVPKETRYAATVKGMDLLVSYIKPVYLVKVVQTSAATVTASG
jgi:hypothetical protein